MDRRDSSQGAADALTDLPHVGGELTTQQVENLRAVARYVPKWFCWGPRRKNSDGEPKLPINPATGASGDHSDEATAGTFDEARAQVGARGYGRGGGVSVSMLGATGNLVGLDFDHVRDPASGELCAFGAEMLRDFGGGYVEVSPSGRGLRVFAIGRGVGHCNVTTPFQGPDGERVKVEVYPAGSKRHLRVTGALVRGAGGSVVDAQVALDRLASRLAVLKAGPDKSKAKTKENSASAGGAMDADQLFQRLCEYRGHKGKTPTAIVEAIKRAAVRSNDIAENLRTVAAGQRGASDAEFFVLCEAIRRDATSAGDAAEVLRALSVPGGRDKWRTHPTYLTDSVERAARAVLESVERGDCRPRGWRNLPGTGESHSGPAPLPPGLPEALGRSGDTLTRTKAGRVDSDKGNVVILFRNDPRLAGLLAFNELSQRAERRGSWRLFDRGGAEQLGAVTDDDVTRVEMWLRREFGMKMDRRDVLQGMEAAARDAKFDPLRDSLLRLRDQWDEKKRVDGWLTRYAKVDDAGCAEYVRAVGRCFLVGAVARAMQPGCQMDTVLAIEGSGGGGKSTMFQILAGAVGPGLFADGIHDASSTAALVEGTSGRWIVELAELAGVRRAADVEALKAALTRRADSYRRPYAMLEVEYPRRFVFVATTNRQQYLADSSGALLRRFWPVRTKATETDPIDRDALAEVAGQLWGEAVALYEAGATWHLDEATEPEAFRQWTQSRELRREDGAFHDECVEWLKKWLPAHDSKGAALRDVAKAAGDLKSAEGDQASLNRLADTLRALGMESRKQGGVKRWFFTPVAARSVQRLIDDDRRRERQEAEEAAQQVNEC